MSNVKLRLFTFEIYWHTPSRKFFGHFSGYLLVTSNRNSTKQRGNCWYLSSSQWKGSDGASLLEPETQGPECSQHPFPFSPNLLLTAWKESLVGEYGCISRRYLLQMKSSFFPWFLWPNSRVTGNQLCWKIRSPILTLWLGWGRKEEVAQNL